LWRKTYDHEIAKDLVQDVFVNIWRNRNNLDSQNNIKAYIYKTASNIAINHIKKKSIKKNYFVNDCETDMKDNSGNSMEFEEYMDDIMMEIPPKQRIVFMLNKFEGFKYKEIAEMLGISVKTVESRMSKTLKTLRNKLKHLIILLLFLFR
jgi:RNA polymerase sigma-70 factor (ECF subfamily)